MNKIFVKFALIIVVAVLSASPLEAQKAKLRRASKMVQNLNYVDAIRVYNEILNKKDNSEAKINLADCYRKINDSENAEYWYGQVVRLPEAQPVHSLYYGEALQKNGKCDQAKEYFTNYSKAVPGDVRGQELAKACDKQKELMSKNEGIYQIENLSFNSNLDDFGPTFYKEGLVFASERDKGFAVKREHTWTGNPFLELYKVESKGLNSTTCSTLSFGKADKFSSELNTKYHEAAVTFSSDLKDIYFTRNNYFEGKTGKSDDRSIKLKIYEAHQQGEAYGEAESMPFNSDEFSTAHPSLTADGNTLYFSSDMPGGYGGMDLYKSTKENGRWSPAFNLGVQINTEGNELFPVIHKSGKLYFSSNGHKGLGGLDIYSVDVLADGSFSVLENIGFPINSTDDDFSLILTDDGFCGFFSSDRTGGAGRDDIYSIKKIATPAEVLVYDALTKQPIEGATVNSTCRNNERSTNIEGKANFDIKLEECCDLTASKEGYNIAKIQACAKGLNLGDKIVIEIPLFKTKKYGLEGVVFDQSTGLPLAGAVVSVDGNCKPAYSNSIVTGPDGRYSIEIPEGCCYNIKAEKLDFLTDTKDNLCTKDLSDTTKLFANLFLQPIMGTSATSTGITVIKDPKTGLWVNKETNKPATGLINGVNYREGEIVGKSTMFQTSILSNEPGKPVAYLLDIYYDFDKYEIREESESELNKLLKLLNDNSKIIVEICSFTDSRGSNIYNKKLSQNRAQSVVTWLANNGISKDRIIPKGYGETLPTNGCINLVKCEENKHQMNRRTEFKVVGCKNCKDPKEGKISKPNKNTKIDPCLNCPF